MALPITLIAALATTRLLVAEMGAQRFGIISLIMSLSALLPIADLGVAAAIVNKTSASRKPADDHELHAVLTTCIRALTVSAFAVMGIAALLFSLELWPTLLGISQGRNEANAAAALAFAIFGLQLPISIGQRMLLGLGDSGRLILLQAVGAPVAFAITYLGVQQEAGLPVLAAATPLGMLVAALLQLAEAGRRSRVPLAVLAANVARLRKRPGVSIRSQALPMLIVTIGLPLALQSDRLILAHAASLEEVARYALALQLYSPGWSVITAAGMGLWPIFARRRAASELGPLSSKALTSSLYGFSLVGLLGGVVLTLVGPALASLVVVDQFRLPTSLVGAFGLLLLVQSVQLPLGMYLTDACGLRFQAMCVTAMVPTSICISLPLAASLGATGPVLGSVVAIAACQVVPALYRIRRETYPVGARAVVLREDNNA